MGSASILEALARYSDVQRIALITPHRPLGDERVRAFFVEAGYDVATLKSFDCQTPLAIAHVSHVALRAAIAEVDAPDVEAIVQVGTNLAMARIAAAAEQQLGKPVIAINTATYWQALRKMGISDRIAGFGRLLEEW